MKPKIDSTSFGSNYCGWKRLFGYEFSFALTAMWGKKREIAFKGSIRNLTQSLA